MATNENGKRPRQDSQNPERAVRDQETKTSTSVTGAGETSVDREKISGDERDLSPGNTEAPLDNLGTEEEHDWELEKSQRAQETYSERSSRKGK